MVPSQDHPNSKAVGNPGRDFALALCSRYNHPISKAAGDPGLGVCHLAANRRRCPVHRAATLLGQRMADHWHDERPGRELPRHHRRGIQNVVTRCLRKAGIARASTHSLRHTFATHSAKKGTKLAVLQKALGHESLHTTSIYVEMAREQMDKELEANAL